MKSLGLNTYVLVIKSKCYVASYSELQFKKACVNFIRMVVEKNKDVISVKKDSWEVHLDYWNKL